MNQLSIQQAFDLTLQHHRAGRLEEAKLIYQQILDCQPNNADVLNSLGVIANKTCCCW